MIEKCEVKARSHSRVGVKCGSHNERATEMHRCIELYESLRRISGVESNLSFRASSR